MQKAVAAIFLLILIGAAAGVWFGREALAKFFYDEAVRFGAERPVVAGLAARLAAYSTTDPGIHFGLGNVFKGLGDNRRALAEFRKAAAADQPYPHAWLEIGRLYFLGKDVVTLDEAVAALSKEIEVSNYPYAYHLRGILYAQKLDRIADAEADFRKETELWSSWAAALNLAWVLADQGKLREAEEAMRLVEARKPGSLFADNGYGVVYLREGRYAAARERLEAAYEKSALLTVEEYREAYPGNPPEYASEGVVSIRAGIAFNLGVVHEKLGDTRQAARWYREALRALPELVHIGIAEGITEQALSDRIEMLESK